MLFLAFFFLQFFFIVSSSLRLPATSRIFSSSRPVIFILIIYVAFGHIPCMRYILSIPSVLLMTSHRNKTITVSLFNRIKFGIHHISSLVSPTLSMAAKRLFSFKQPASLLGVLFLLLARSISAEDDCKWVVPFMLELAETYTHFYRFSSSTQLHSQP